MEIFSDKMIVATLSRQLSLSFCGQGDAELSSADAQMRLHGLKCYWMFWRFWT